MDALRTFIRNNEILINSHIRELQIILNNEELIDICDKFSELKEKINNYELGFNVFVLTSDLYYRENYHSDILKAFLNPKENHHQGNRFLFVLIDLLNNSFSKFEIDKQNYLESEAKREDGKLDILILSEISKHCIIIENKIKDAPDMPRQLPRYYDDMVSKGYSVDAIIYIPLNQNKYPDTSDWNEDDFKKIKPLLCHLPAYTIDKTPNLVNEWVLPCTIVTDDIDCLSILRQYGNLVKSLNINTMDKSLIEKFYKILLEGENYKNVLSISSMLEDLPKFMALRLVDLFKNKYPNIYVYHWPDKDTQYCVLQFYVENISYKIDIIPSLEEYKVQLFRWGGESSLEVPWAAAIVKDWHITDDERYEIVFPFKEETKVIECVEEILDLVGIKQLTL